MPGSVGCHISQTRRYSRHTRHTLKFFVPVPIYQIVALSKALGRPIQTFQAFMPPRTINEELSGPVVRLS